MTTARWYITAHAVERYMHVRRFPEPDFARAERELLALAPSAKLRQTDTQGRELYRSGMPLQLRWVVSHAQRVEGPLPQVVWVGQGKPPGRHWTPAESEPEPPVPVDAKRERTRGGARAGAGRPRLSPEGAGANLTVRLSDDARATLDALCERYSETQAGVIRLALAKLAATR